MTGKAKNNGTSRFSEHSKKNLFGTLNMRQYREQGKIRTESFPTK